VEVTLLQAARIITRTVMVAIITAMIMAPATTAALQEIPHILPQVEVEVEAEAEVVNKKTCLSYKIQALKLKMHKVLLCKLSWILLFNLL